MPRAGEWANAFYERGTRSLQFFSFVGTAGGRVHTALSRDIVAHECGHALLDAVVPSLYDSSTPQSVAIHEAVADLVAVLMALDSEPTAGGGAGAQRATRSTGENAFNAIAEEFGMARPSATAARRALRDLKNDETLSTLAGARPHILSTLLSGIFYDTLSFIFATRFEAEQRPDAERCRRERRRQPRTRRSAPRRSSSAGSCSAGSTTCRRASSASPTWAGRPWRPTGQPVRTPTPARPSSSSGTTSPRSSSTRLVVADAA